MPYPETVQKVGGEGGAPFSFTDKKNGTSLVKIGVWVGGWQVKAVKVWLSDGRRETFGKPAGPYQEYAFKLGEYFTSLSLWANREGSRLGAIKFKTNKGGIFFFAKMTDYELPTEIHIDVGSGYCLGVEGKCGADIDNMGFMFLNAVQSTVLTDVNYPTINQLTPKVIVEEIKSATYQNKTSTIQQQIIETSKKMTKTASWSMSGSLTATFGVEVKAGIPVILEASTGFIVTVGEESTYNHEQTNERTETLPIDVEVPPGKKVDVDITIGRATFDLPYTGTVKITCKNGSVLQYKTQGTYKGITYTDIKVNTEADVLVKFWFLATVAFGLACSVGDTKILN